MNINIKYKDIIDYLNSIDGVVPINETWYTIGKKFNVEAPDSERAKVDEAYRIKAIGTKAQDIWRYYISKKNSLSLVKEVYKDGKLLLKLTRKKQNLFPLTKTTLQYHLLLQVLMVVPGLNIKKQKNHLMKNK